MSSKLLAHILSDEYIFTEYALDRTIRNIKSGVNHFKLSISDKALDKYFLFSVNDNLFRHNSSYLGFAQLNALGDVQNKESNVDFIEIDSLEICLRFGIYKKIINLNLSNDIGIINEAIDHESAHIIQFLFMVKELDGKLYYDNKFRNKKEYLDHNGLFQDVMIYLGYKEPNSSVIAKNYRENLSEEEETAKLVDDYIKKLIYYRCACINKPFYIFDKRDLSDVQAGIRNNNKLYFCNDCRTKMVKVYDKKKSNADKIHLQLTEKIKEFIANKKASSVV